LTSAHSAAVDYAVLGGAVRWSPRQGWAEQRRSDGAAV